MGILLPSWPPRDGRVRLGWAGAGTVVLLLPTFFFGGEGEEGGRGGQPAASSDTYPPPDPILLKRYSVLVLVADSAETAAVWCASAGSPAARSTYHGVDQSTVG